MALSVISTSTYESGSGGYNNVHTLSGIDASAGDLVLVGIYQRNPLSEVSSITIDGTTATRHGSSVATNVAGVEWAYLTGTFGSSISVVVNTPSYKLCAFTVTVISGADQSAPIDTSQTATNTGYGKDTTVAITAAASDSILFHAANYRNAHTISPANSETELADFDHADANLGQCGLYSYAPGSTGSHNLGARYTSGSGDNWAGSSIEVSASSGGTTLSPAEASWQFIADSTTAGTIVDSHSISFNGSSSVATAPDNNFDGLSAGTIEFFFKQPNVMSAYEKLVFKNGCYDVGLTNSGALFGEIGGVGNLGIVGSNEDDDTWHHVAFTWDGSNLRAYLDGVHVGSTASSSTQTDNTNQFGLGKHLANNSEYFSGLFGGFLRISNTARYTGTGSFTVPNSVPANDANTLMLIDFTDGIGSTATDLSSHGNDLALTDTTWDEDSPFVTAVTVAPNDSAWQFIADATIISQNHVVAPTGSSLSFFADSTTISQNHGITPSDSSFTFIADTTAIEQNHVVTGDDAAWVFTADSTTATESNFVIQTQNANFNFVADNSTINQNHILAPTDSAWQFLSDTTTISQDHVLIPQDGSWTFIADTTGFTQEQTIVTQDAAWVFTADSDTITQDHTIATQDALFNFVADNTTINQNHLLSPTEAAWLFNATTTDLSESQIIETQDAQFTFISDSASISQNHVIGGNDAQLTFVADNSPLTQNHVFAPNDSSFGFLADSAAVGESGFTLSVQDALLQFFADTSTIAQNHALTSNDTSMEFVADSTTIGQDHRLSPADSAFEFLADVGSFSQSHVLDTQEAEWLFSADSTNTAVNHVLTPDDASFDFVADLSTVIDENQVDIIPQSASFGGQSLPSIMFDVDGNPYKRLQSNKLVKL